MRSTLPCAVLLSAVILVASSCGGGGGGDSPGPAGTGTPASVGNLTISSRVVWSNATVVVTGTVTIVSGGELVLNGATVRFSPRIDDTRTLVLTGTAKLTASQSRFDSATGRQWNMYAYNASAISVSATVMTLHSGLRCFDATTFVADGASAVEELQVHDNAVATVRNGSSAYLVLFFTGGVTTSLANGQLGAGSGITRTFSFPTGPTTTGQVSLSSADVIGWQLDIVDSTSLTVDGGESVVLALHLQDKTATVSQSIGSTQAGSGTVDFSSGGGPRFSYTNSVVMEMNLYADGACNLTFTGTVVVNEPNTNDSSRVEYGPGCSVFANLAATTGFGEMVFNGVTLIESSGSIPSFTAMDGSILRITNVTATANTRVASVDGGQVFITGGSGWTPNRFDAVNPTGAGGVYVNGTRVVP